MTIQEIALNSGSGAAFIQMRAQGRTEWNEADYDLAAQTRSAVLAQLKPCKECPFPSDCPECPYKGDC
jgi:hypothetical protein